MESELMELSGEEVANGCQSSAIFATDAPVVSAVVAFLCCAAHSGGVSSGSSSNIERFFVLVTVTHR